MSEDSSRIRFVTPRGRLFALGAVCLAAAVLGVFVVLLNGDNVLALIAGTAAIGIFGVGGGVSIINQLRHSTILRADADGIRVAKIGRAPWADIDRIGTTPQGELGVRFRRTDALLAGDPSGTDAESLRATRRTSGGYDLTFAERELGTTPAEAARKLRARQP
ncbi:hypothetical protein LQ938_06540 [Microbacterium sp. cx-55]|uniref:hypothetical protein n=1 Tax=Microbacterium sp. cx-55 TaxID=2875948 RepID=UPI001CBFD364|nr:hypothetical protein [Microbacterium sp. cx-55]MBZ4486598.1 hypothetical protein [Microbacterium sp. cx-55]UGB36435.1 hypothetical protein LQ938_06540 [Microbacterium sp. cx-55]